MIASYLCIACYKDTIPEERECTAIVSSDEETVCHGLELAEQNMEEEKILSKMIVDEVEEEKWVCSAYQDHYTVTANLG